MKHVVAFAICALMTSQTLSATAALRVWKAANPVQNEYIVVLADQHSRDIDAVVNRLTLLHHGRVLVLLRNGVKAFGAVLSAEQAEVLAANPLVDHVEENARVFLSGQDYFTDNTFWHLDRIDSTTWGMNALNRIYSYTNTGAGVNAYVLDTGVLANHQEFGGRVRAGATFADGNPATWPCCVGIFTTAI